MESKATESAKITNVGFDPQTASPASSMSDEKAQKLNDLNLKYHIGTF